MYKIDHKNLRAKIKNLEQRLDFQRYNIREKQKEKGRKKEKKKKEKELLKNKQTNKKTKKQIRAEINAKETKETIAKINKAKSWFFEHISKQGNKQKNLISALFKYE